MAEEFCLENREGCKSSRAFESFRRRGIIEKPSRGDTVLTNSLILYGSVAQLARAVALGVYSEKLLQVGVAPAIPTIKLLVEDSSSSRPTIQ